MPKIDSSLVPALKRYRDVVVDGYTAIIAMTEEGDLNGAANMMAALVTDQAKMSVRMTNAANDGKFNVPGQ